MCGLVPLLCGAPDEAAPIHGGGGKGGLDDKGNERFEPVTCVAPPLDAPHHSCRCNRVFDGGKGIWGGWSLLFLLPMGLHLG